MKFKIGDRVRLVAVVDGNMAIVGKEGVIAVVDNEQPLPYGVDFGVRYHQDLHNLSNRIQTKAGWFCPEHSLVLVTESIEYMDPSKKAKLEEIGDSLIAKTSPISTITVTTEYRSSMAASAAIKPSMSVRLGRSLTVQGIRI